MMKDTVSQMNLTSNKCTTLCLSTIISLAATTSFCSAENIAWENGRRPLLGVQRWDMYSGKGATQEQELGYLPGKQGFLKAPQWHDRAPFFCRLTEDVDWVTHPAEAGPLWFNYPFRQELLQESMDQEIRYAHNAGIDFFIYNGPVRKLIPKAYELKNNLDCHVASNIPENRTIPGRRSKKLPQQREIMID